MAPASGNDDVRIGFGRTSGTNSNDEFSIRLGSSEMVELTVDTDYCGGGTTGYTPFPYVPDTWEEVTVIMDKIAGTIEFYYFNTLIFTANCSLSSVSQFQITASNGTAGQYFIDNVTMATDEDVPLEPEDPFLNSSTYINITAPTSTTASRTFDVDFNYQMLDNYPQADEFSHILFTLCARSYSNDECIKFSTTTASLNSSHSSTIELTAVRDGYHLLLANFWNGVSENTDCPWWNIFCEEETSLVGVGTSVNFNVATTTIDADVPEWILNGNFCGGLSGLVDVAICNALAFLFVPDSTSLDKIFTLDEVLAQKQPFGFFFLVQQKMTEVGATEGSAGAGLTVDTGAGALGEVEFFNFASAKSEMTAMGMDTTEVQDIMIWMLWLMLGWYVWHRTMTVANPTSPKQLNLIGQEV